MMVLEDSVVVEDEEEGIEEAEAVEVAFEAAEAAVLVEG